MALLVALVVFFGILFTTPPGFQAFRDLLVQSDDDARVLRAAYALGAAAFYSLAALILVGVLLALLAACVEWLRGRPRTNGQREPS